MTVGRVPLGRTPIKVAEGLERIASRLEGAVAAEFVAQGHSNTGKTLKTIEFKRNGFSIELTMAEHAVILDKGVKASRIPYGGRGGGGRSKFIQGLIKYFKSKGFGKEDSKSMAFATANKMKQEGMSTKASSRFSSTGKRQGFINIAIKKNKRWLDRQVDKLLDEQVDLDIKELLK